MAIKKFEIIVGIIAIICVLYKILLYIFYINYITTTVIIFFFFSTFLLNIFYLYYIFMIIPLKSNRINRMRANLALLTRKKIIPYITSLLFFFEFIMMGIVYFYVKDYWDNCPFFIYDDLNKHYNRRCELYNINHNSRYSYQYICSFDPSGPFKYETETHFLYDKKVEKKLRKKIQPDYLRCIRLNSLITDNEVITLFINEYKNSKNYYCSRTNKPKKNFSISDKDCKSKKK